MGEDCSCTLGSKKTKEKKHNKTKTRFAQDLDLAKSDDCVKLILAFERSCTPFTSTKLNGYVDGDGCSERLLNGI